MGDIQVKKRHSIKKSAVAQLKRALEGELGADAALFDAKRLEVVETDSEFLIYLVDKKPLLMEFEGWTFPTVRGAVERPFEARRVTVDSGAVPYVMNGADIMRPGVVDATPDVKEGAPCIITEERYGKPLAVGIALYDGAELLAQEKGKVVRTLHRVGDSIWNLEL
ncbi:PUA domain protein [Methanofollis sp. W23]|uniref:RNA-binding protein n=1 Tax=Methanofollis sp. W23 TaxID=2817849 RepID=UPI001AE9A122|nr:RNA-binding protein [Methanofollis sp. W23]MBP2147044.1 PUA domain protein [Methanofollis sp. W23]